MRRRHLLGATAAALVAPAIVRAQGKYPDRSIRLVIPFPPGGPTDMIGRMVAEKLTAVLGQQVIIDNKAGAAGAIASVEVKNAKPDGHTLLFATSSTHATNPTTMVRPAYDAVKDFAPVSSICVNPVVIIAHPSMPDTLKGLIALMKANPGKYSYGSSGAGGIAHLAAELFKTMAGGLEVVHVPYRGSGPALQDMLAGQTAWMMETVSTSLQLHRSGKLRLLGFGHASRAAIAPEIPTFSEAGLPGYEAYTFNLILAPAGTPPDIVDALSKATRTIMSDKTTIKSLEDIAAIPMLESTPASTAKFITDEIAKWAPVIKATGVKIE